MSHRGRRGDRRIDGVGPVPCDLMLVGEGPGFDEHRRGVPFVGRAGGVLTDGLSRIGINRLDVFITNLTRYHIFHNLDPTPAEIADDAPYLEAEIAKVRPRAIVTLGRFSARYLLDDPTVTMDRCHGYVLQPPGRPFTVFVMYHPAAGLHDSDRMAQVMWDFDRLGQYLDGDLAVHTPEARETAVVPIRALVAHAQTARAAGAPIDLGIDTEFDGQDPIGRPWGLSISAVPGEAAIVRADDPAGLQAVTGLVDTARHVYIHNLMADLSVLRAMGVDLVPYLAPHPAPHPAPHLTTHPTPHPAPDRARVLDTMMMVWHHGLHPQGLKDLAWRYLGLVMRSFDDLLAPTQALLAYEYLTRAQEAGPWSPPELQITFTDDDQVKVGKPWGADRYLAALVKDFVTKPDVDLLARWAGINPIPRQEVEAVLGPMPIATVFDVDPEEAARYAAQDADVTRRLGPILLQQAADDDLLSVLDGDLPAVPLFDRMQQAGLPCDVPYLDRLSAEMRARCDQLRADLETIVGHRINPRSPDQVALLLFDELGITPHTRTKTGKPSTARRALKPHQDTHLEVGLILAYKELAKIDDAFARNIPQWVRPAPDGEPRCYPNWRVTRVKTGRPATNRPNILAIPSRTAEGKRVRMGFRAREGRLLGAWDESQLEMRICAHQSRDEKLVALYNLDPETSEPWERDVHIQVAAMIYGCDPRDVQKAWRTACKAAGFGILMGMTKHGLYDQMRLYGLTDVGPDQCEQLIAEWLAHYTGVRDYQLQRRAEARRTGEVRDLFGRRYRLPGIGSTDTGIREEAERQSHALDIQGSAQGLFKRIMARLAYETLPRYHARGVHLEPLVQLHDEMIMEFDAAAAEDIHRDMVDVMTTTVDLLVPLESSGDVGPSWGELEK